MNLAVALAVALPVLAAPGTSTASAAAARADDLRLGYAAAFAAASKLEGVALAAIVVALHLGRRARAGGLRELGRAALPAALPAALVAAPWLAANLHHGLLSANHPRSLDLGRAAEVLPAVAAALGTREWHGFAWLLPPLVAALGLARRTRPIGLACAALLAFYLWVYLASPLEPRFYVLSSLPRLLFHVAPAALVGTVALLSPRRTKPEPPEVGSGQRAP